MPLRAVIYLPAAVEVARWLPVCLAHCQREGYEVVSVVTAAGWAGVTQMLSTGQAEVCVITRREHLPADRVPRIEEAADSLSGRPSSRRPRRR